ncbi:PAS domain S-box protein [Paenibacillus sp. SYP-B3998]|uniref:histidine kinase n=1 Tax=Paenibacillus sp. SYP-B3998 TaxID=2678564 RepID=A0A6G4A045_9BACL|nr:PAS domain S-box protein [Paenibacillus sp. SYP-B3998]NEW07833.1 PAS domain S-box protein [Paenibacillus sp. SYP-B3998]
MAEFTGNPTYRRKMIPAELGLLTSEDLFHHSFGCAAIGMALVSLDGRFLMVNTTLCNLIGFTDDELVGRHYGEFSYPDDLEIDLQLQKQTLLGDRRSFQLEKRYVHQDGSLIWGILSVSLVRDLEGAPLYFVSQFQDITERKRIEQKLEESRLRYLSLLKHNPDIICTLDETGKLVTINPATRRITGYTKQELIGKTLLPIVMPEQWQQVKNMFFQAQQGLIGHAEIQVIHKQGHLLILEVSVVPMIIHNQASGIYVIAKDITKRKRNEVMIDELHTKNQLILNAVSDGIFGIDEQLGTIFWNEAAKRLTGYTYDEMVGKNPFLILTQACEAEQSMGLTSQLPLYRSMLEGAHDYDSNEIFYKKNGDPFPVEYMSSPIYDHGRIVGVVITFKDIKERQKTEEMLRKSDKLSVVGQIAAGVAHEIRNPLTSLKGFTQFLQSGAVNKKEYYEIMLSELNRIELIITEMLVLAKPQMVNFQPKSLEMILNSVVILLETQANMSNIQFTMGIQEDLARVLCEENQLKQSFINLIKNAMEAMQDGGQIDIVLRAEGSRHVQIVIKDQGEGMPEDVLARLGEPFYTTKDKGTGLGIMITNKIIEDHNGHLLVESKEGEGTVVSVTLPVHQ